MHLSYIVITVIAFALRIKANPKKYVPEEGGFQPSSLRYYESNLPITNNNSRKDDIENKDNSDRLQRFGYISSIGNSGTGTQTYGGTGIGTMVPMKIDIGGIALGAIIGLGAILIIPKLAQVFSSGYGYRSLDDDSTSLSDILSKLDNTLEQHNIDSSSCMQRIICSYVQEAQKNMKKGEATTTDQLVYSVSNNSLFTYMLDGSSIKQAIDMGKHGDLEKCSNLYVKCPVSRDNIMQILSNLLPA